MQCSLCHTVISGTGWSFGGSCQEVYRRDRVGQTILSRSYSPDDNLFGRTFHGRSAKLVMVQFCFRNYCCIFLVSVGMTNNDTTHGIDNGFVVYKCLLVPSGCIHPFFLIKENE